MVRWGASEDESKRDMGEWGTAVKERRKQRQPSPYLLIKCPLLAFAASYSPLHAAEAEGARVALLVDGRYLQELFPDYCGRTSGRQIVQLFGSCSRLYESG